jgi:hypothetical protein
VSNRTFARPVPSGQLPMLMIIHFAFRLSLIDERCRRMAIELALLGSPPRRCVRRKGRTRAVQDIPQNTPSPVDPDPVRATRPPKFLANTSRIRLAMTPFVPKFYATWDV